MGNFQSEQVIMTARFKKNVNCVNRKCQSIQRLLARTVLIFNQISTSIYYAIQRIKNTHLSS